MWWGHFGKKGQSCRIAKIWKFGRLSVTFETLEVKVQMGGLIYDSLVKVQMGANGG